MTRIRISTNGKYASKDTYEARVENSKEYFCGSIDKKYISKSKQKEVEKWTFAYVNQPKERIV